MSQIIHTSDKNKNRKRETNIFSSTPIKPSVLNYSSISLSEIDSSSSGSKIIRSIQSLIPNPPNKHERYSKRKKRPDTKWKKKDSNKEWEAKPKEIINQSLNEKRKKKLKSKKETIKKKLIVTQTKGEDSEWETESEKLINKFSICSQSTLKDDEHIKLFEDLCSTPEKIRDAPRTYEDILPESPIIGSFRKRSHLISKKNDILPRTYEDILPKSPIIGSFRKRSHLILKKNDILPRTYEDILPESSIILESFRKRFTFKHLISKHKNDIILQNELLPVNWLPSEIIRNLEKASEDETIFDYKGNKEAHVPLQKPEISSKQTSENFSFPDLQSSTTNFRSDQPVKTYSRKTSPHLKSFELSPIKLMSFRPKRPRLPNSRKTESIKTSPGMICVSGYRNKNDKKWKTYKGSSSEKELKNDKRKTKTSNRNMRNQKRKIRKVSQKTKTKRAFQSISRQKYDIDDKIDIEFETGGRDGKRMSFREFCQAKGSRNHKMSRSREVSQKTKTKRVFQSTSKQKYDMDDEIDIEFETGGRDGKRMPFREFFKQKVVEIIKCPDSIKISSSDSLF